MLHKRICIECGKEFMHTSEKAGICSDECRNKRQLTLRKRNRKKVRYEPTGFVKPKVEAGDEITVKNKPPDHKQVKIRKARVIKCYRDFALCQLENYRECFMLEDIQGGLSNVGK